ncbi:MAG: cobalamin biosynthesis protein CbiD [Oscillospiraceae bacterium]|jgi:cobalt-precorrin-5B (C1)-methyltransferase|nr:cobalamin biosynthesis protein CbiD [Oscillospiraceae bacterium]
MEEYIVKDGKKLRLGYTTGSCAAAAAKAAAVMLLTGRRLETVALLTPKGIRLELEVREVETGPGYVSCAIAKDAGDDPDVTDGALIFARVSRREEPGIVIDGGPGVGRVTKPGLDQPVGAAAINSVPRRMIRENLEEVCALADWSGGLEAVISVPEGERLAKKTFNPRLGIAGGISILGTTGIVEPMSDGALVGTIRAELSQRRAAGDCYVLLTPGNYGSEFIRDGLGLDPALAVQTSNFIGDALDLCRELGFSGALLVGHVGKLVKLAGGMLNTHSRWGDCRMEILAAHAGAAGAPPERLGELLECAACDDALRILREAGVYRETLERLTRRAAFHLSARAGEDLEVGTVLFSKVYGILGRTENAEALLNCIRSCPLGRRQ